MKHQPRSYRDVSVPGARPLWRFSCHKPHYHIGDAIRSYPSGSAAGPDRVTPQILKDLISQPGVLSGKAPCLIRPHFFGANLFALSKKSGGVRTLAVYKDNAVLRLASTCGGRSVWWL